MGTWLFSILPHKISDHYRREGAAGGPSGASSGAEAEAGSGSGSRAIVAFFTSEGYWRNAPSRWKRPDERFRTTNSGVFSTAAWAGCPDALGKLLLRELDQLDQEELCKVLDLTPGNLRVRLHPARLCFRDCLTTKWFGSRSERAPRKP